MENESMNMIPSIDTASVPAPEYITAQENPPALIKKIGGMTYMCISVPPARKHSAIRSSGYCEMKSGS